MAPCLLGDLTPVLGFSKQAPLAKGADLREKTLGETEAETLEVTGDSPFCFARLPRLGFILFWVLGFCESF